MAESTLASIAETLAEAPERAAATPVSEPAIEPPVFDTYAMVYALSLLFLVPGSIAIGSLPFRTYTPSYVSLVTVPFVLGVVLTFLTDSRDSWKAVLRRILVLTPLILVSGVMVMFVTVMLMVPFNAVLGQAARTHTPPFAGAALLLVASPLLFGLYRRVRRPAGLRSAVQALVMLLAAITVGIVFYMSVFHVGELWDVAHLVRKDIIIYIVGGLVWYLPSFGISAGIWRRIGLV